MRTRYLDQKEKEATRTLYESAFPSDGKGFVDYYYQEKMRDNRVLILEKGGIAQYGGPDEIIRRPANRFVKDFILNQLEIKRNNIYQLFSGVVPAADMAQASGQIG